MTDPLTERLAALAAKYRELAVLRARREALEASGHVRFPPDEGGVRRATFRDLARRFPGALRELDRTCAANLRARARLIEEEVERARAGQPVSRRWVEVVLDYHDTLREALALKYWLARRVGPQGTITDEVVAEAASWLAARGERPGTHVPAEREALARLHHPPGGRIMPFVWETLARRHGLPRRELVHLVFEALD